MTTKQQSQLTSWGSLISIAVVLVAAVSAIMTIKASAATAIEKAVTAKESIIRLEDKLEKTEMLAEQNARDFAFFKGEVNAKLDSIMASMRRQETFIQNLEIDHGKNSSP